MSSKADNQPDNRSDAASATEQRSSAPEEIAPREKTKTLEERLLALDEKSSKRALHDSRVLKRIGTLFFVLGGCALLLEPFLLVLPRLPGFNTWGSASRKPL